MMGCVLAGVACRGAAPAPPSRGALVDATPAELAARIAASKAEVLVANVWATWCEPCKEELPAFLRLRRAYASRGVELLLVSGDVEGARADAEAFLGTLGVDFETYRKKGGDMELIDAMHRDWSGSLPATIIYGPGGKHLWFFEGSVTYEVLEREVLRVLGGGA
jgi:thiol-disulfide isomerase/thioredoxin